VWYDQTTGLPDDARLTAMHELGPGMDSAGVPMEHRATVLWAEKTGEPRTFAKGYLFASPEALRAMRLDPLMIPVRGEDRPYRAKPAGYVGNPGGYVPPHYPASYRGTPLPNRLMAFVLTPIETGYEVRPELGELVVKPIMAR
jgi:hypothetical protein